MKKIILFIGVYLSLGDIIITSPSSLDTSFADNGATTNLFVANTINQAQATVAQNDGKIVVAGYAGDNAIIIRYNNDGSLDLTFNDTGIVSVNLGTQTAAYGMAIDPTTNKIIIVGYVTINGIDNAFIARYKTDGSIDTTFNSTGYITTIFGAQSQLFGVSLQLDGSIVVAGWATYLGFTNALVARYLDTGDLDTSFNTTGFTLTLIGEIFTKARAIDIQANGKIVVTGQADIDGNQQLIVMRFLSTGTLDTTAFNSSGDFPGTICPLASDCITSTGYGITLQANQRIVAVGGANPFDLGFDQQKYTILRLNTDGTLDTSFNATDITSQGFIMSDSGLQANSVVIQRDNKIVTCGYNYADNNYIIVVIRFENDGSVDPTFNFTVDSPETNTLGYAVALQVDGKIIVSGTRAIHFNQ